MMPRFLSLILALFCLAAAPKPLELWQITFNSTKPDAPQLPPPQAPWQPAMWTTGILGGSSTPEDVRRLVTLCKDGGNLKDGIGAKTLAYLNAVNRTDSFPGGVVPRRTLLMADFEGAPDSYAATFCGQIRKQTANYVPYPGFINDDGINFGYLPRMWEVDFFCISRAWLNGNHSAIRQKLGDYYLTELYLFDTKIGGDQDAQFRTWALMLAAARRQLPSVKQIALCKGSYAWPGTGVMTDVERHRLARFCLLFDAVLAFGDRSEAAPLMADIAAVNADCIHPFPGEEGWPGARVPATR